MCGLQVFISPFLLSFISLWEDYTPPPPKKLNPLLHLPPELEECTITPLPI